MTTYQEHSAIVGMLAGANLSAAGNQYKLVKIASTAGEVVLVGSTSILSIGVLQNNPADGEVAQVCIHGISKLLVGPTDVAINDRLGSDSTSRGADHTTDNQPVIALALEASSAAGDLIRVYVTGPSRF